MFRGRFAAVFEALGAWQELVGKGGTRNLTGWLGMQEQETELDAFIELHHETGRPLLLDARARAPTHPLGIDDIAPAPSSGAPPPSVTSHPCAVLVAELGCADLEHEKAMGLQWECSACSFLNSGETSACDMCGTAPVDGANGASRWRRRNSPCERRLHGAVPQSSRVPSLTLVGGSVWVGWGSRSAQARKVVALAGQAAESAR